MTYQAALKLTAEITTLTIQHMADSVGITFEEALIAATTTENGKKRFLAYMDLAYQAVKSH
jgi:hypothetical protein